MVKDADHLFFPPLVREFWISDSQNKLYPDGKNNFNNVL